MTASSCWRLSAVVKHSLCGSEPTALEAVGCEWRYALLVVQARNDGNILIFICSKMQQTTSNDDDDCIGSTLGKLSRVLSRICEIFIETLNKNFTEFVNIRKLHEIFYINSYLSE